MKAQRFTLEVDGYVHEVVVDPAKGTVLVDDASFPLDGEGVVLRGPGNAAIGDAVVRFRIDAVARAGGGGGGGATGPVKVRPPMTGRLESLRVKQGQAVQKGDVLFVLEAMKMHNEVKAPASGTVAVIHLQPGATLETNQVVLEIQAA